MGTNETDVHYTTDEDYYRNNTVIIATDIEYIATILHVVCRREHFLKLRRGLPIAQLSRLQPISSKVSQPEHESAQSHPKVPY